MFNPLCKSRTFSRAFYRKNSNFTFDSSHYRLLEKDTSQKGLEPQSFYLQSPLLSEINYFILFLFYWTDNFTFVFFLQTNTDTLIDFEAKLFLKIFQKAEKIRLVFSFSFSF